MMNAPILFSKNLLIGYDKPLMLPLNFSVFSGDFICLMGRNGSGKSTLFKTFASQISSLGGELYLKEKKIEMYNAQEKSRLMSFVFSGKNFNESLLVSEILSLARAPFTNFWGKLSKHDENVIDEISTLMGITEFFKKPLSELSDGQKQKVWIARAFVQDTPLVFLDEPTNYLDIPHRLEILSLLRVMAREKSKAIIFSSHDWDLVLSSASWLWLIDGTSFFKGLPEDFILNGTFQNVFSKDIYLFDSERGVFKQKHEKKFEFIFEVLSTQKEREHWTLHALLKMGFVPVLGKENLPKVLVKDDSWEVSFLGQLKNCKSLEEVFNSLGRF